MAIPARRSGTHAAARDTGAGGATDGCASTGTCRAAVVVVAVAVGPPPGPTASARGVGYWPGDGKLAPRILFMSGNRLIAGRCRVGRAG
jgi:hypothetical protein